MLHSLMHYAEGLSSPLLMVIVLGIVFALDPCLMLTNIAAIGYIGKEVGDKKSAFRKGLYYTLGRTIVYGILGVVLISFLNLGKSIHPIEHFFHEWGPVIVVPFMIIVGLLLCIADYVPFLRVNGVSNLDKQRFQGNIGAFLLGAVLTFAFCPTNAILFFGMMVPVCATSNFGYILPFVFAAVTALPVIAISYLVAFSLNSIGKYYNKLRQIGVVLRWVAGILLIIAGIYLAFHGLEHGAHEHMHIH